MLVFLIVIIVLFAAAFITKRRFGVLGLALAAGTLMSELWTNELTPIVAEAGIFNSTVPPLSSIVAAALVLLPAGLLLLSGPVYRTVRPRIVGSLAFAVLALTLLLEPMGMSLALEGVSRQVYDLITNNRTGIITAGLVFALIDILLTKTPKPPKDKSKH